MKSEARDANQSRNSQSRLVNVEVSGTRGADGVAEISWPSSAPEDLYRMPRADDACPWKNSANLV